MIRMMNETYRVMEDQVVAAAGGADVLMMQGGGVGAQPFWSARLVRPGVSRARSR